ncbi:MAG: acyl-CoA dehydrogenase [Deltaproteobacteria bacterium]|nr:acyl-CoA dehydrogenase [Deltaproteobacteria bacterium]
MAERFMSERNLKFVLYEVLDLESLTKLPYYQDHSREIFDLTLDTAIRMGRDLLAPAFQEMDKQQPQLVNGEVKVHSLVRTFMKESGEGGWIGAGFPYDAGGQQLPTTVAMAAGFVFGAANFAAGAYPLLTTGASHLILSFGSDELREIYVPQMLSGKWQGTMALTEPQAGSSLSDITTRAEPTDEGYYKIFGQKIFISAGDHSGVDNVIHLMLAKIKGAPLGVKGISLFVVPKKRLDPDGTLVSNDVTTVGVYHKMGYKGCPITQLSMGENGDCRGYLVGEPHKGLSYMFQMMNEARLGVGMQATSIAAAAYYASLEYAGERPQGRKIATKDPSLPQVPIIEHADVRRMLLFQRAITEGSLSLLLQCSLYADLAAHSEGEEKERYDLLLDLLTPVAKSYPSEMGILSVSQGLQILGGYGYCDEFPLEQYYRDIRIHPIHEGTTGIQALDLLGRKVVMKNGAAARLYFEEVYQAITPALQDPTLKPYAEKLQEALGTLQAVTTHLVGFALKGEVELFLADATLYLELFGIIAVAWQWLLQGLAAQEGLQAGPTEQEALFYQGKLMTMRYFYHYEFPKIQGLATRLTDGVAVTTEMNRELFAD